MCLETLKSYNTLNSYPCMPTLLFVGNRALVIMQLTRSTILVVACCHLFAMPSIGISLFFHKHVVKILSITLFYMKTCSFSEVKEYIDMQGDSC